MDRLENLAYFDFMCVENETRVHMGRYGENATGYR